MTSGQWWCHHLSRNTGTNMINCCCAKNWHVFRNLGRPRAPETIGASFNIWAAWASAGHSHHRTISRGLIRSGETGNGNSSNYSSSDQHPATEQRAVSREKSTHQRIVPATISLDNAVGHCWCFVWANIIIAPVHMNCTLDGYCPLAMANNPIDNSIVPNECPEHIPHSSELTPQSPNVIAIRVHPSLWFTGWSWLKCMHVSFPMLPQLALRFGQFKQICRFDGSCLKFRTHSLWCPQIKYIKIK